MNLGSANKFQPISGGGKTGRVEEAAGQLIVTDGDSMVDFQMAEHSLDAIALLVEHAVMPGFYPAV